MTAANHKEIPTFHDIEILEEQIRILKMEKAILIVKNHELKKTIQNLEHTLVVEQENEFVAGY